jgi:enoyl-CoA hydratase
VDILGRERALALLLDGGTLDASSAVAQGLALRLEDDPLVAAHQLAARWAALDSALARDVKATVSVAHRGPFKHALEIESWAQASSATGPLIQEAVARFVK